jgi:TolA-binding protein
MRKKMPNSFGFIKVTLTFFLLACPFVSRAQFEGLRAEEVLMEADVLLKSKRPSDAIPYLKAYLDRVAGVEDPRVLSMAQDVRLKLAVIKIQDKDFSSAVELLEMYLSKGPRPAWNEAMKYLSTTLLEISEFEKCVGVTTKALEGPPPNVLAEIAPSAAPKAEGGGEVAEETPKTEEAPKYEFDRYGEVIKTEGKPAAQKNTSGYSQEDLLLLNLNLGEAYRGLKKSASSIAPFNYVAEHTDNEISRGYAIMQVVNAMIEIKDFEKLTEKISQLYRTNARYDIRVNLALMNAATALYDEKEYDNALPLYRMILPREELIAYHAIKTRELKIKAGLIPAEQSGPSTYKAKMDETLFGKKYSVIVEEFWSENERDANPNKPKELLEMEDLIHTINGLPPYENEVLYRSALLYDEVGRPWESVRFFDRVLKNDPAGELGMRSFYDVIRLLLEPLGEIGEAEQRGYAYLDKTKDGIIPRQVAYSLSGYYQKHDQMAKVKQLLPYIQGFIPSSDGMVLKYDCELYYMQAVADLMMVNYELAEVAFKKVLTKFPGSHQEDNATYWHAVTMMFLEKYEAALAEFESYPERFPRGEWIAPALFQSGTCYFGMEKYDQALERFSQVIKRYPDSQVFPDACSLRADIYGSRGLLDEAMLDYKSAIAKARTHAQAKYAVFQMAAMFEAESRHPEIIALVNEYLNRYGDQADISEGIYWIGKTKINQGLIDDAVKSYYDAIVRYGADMKQGGVDSVIAELVKTAKTRLSEKSRDGLNTLLRNAVQKTDSLTLQLRLRATLAQIDGTEIELGKTLIRELPNLDSAAPPVLAAICKASFENKDYSRAEEILKVFLAKFENSEFMRAAYRLRGFDLYSAGKFDEALKLVGDVQGLYGEDYDAAWAQLMKGDILLLKGRYDEARQAFKNVFNVRGWRGEFYAEATYKLGQIEESAGDVRKAFGWYQRTYIQYKSYAKGYWAAEAYLSSARCLKQMGLENDVRNTYRAMLFDKYVNGLPQANEAIAALGAEEVLEIKTMIASGVSTNLTVILEAEVAK